MTDKPRSQAEYVWSVSEEFPCESLHDSRMVAEFHNTVLAVYPKGEEIRFATAIFIEDKTKLADWFYYGTDFDEARKDFAIRSNLVSQDDFLSKEEKLLVGDTISHGFETNFFQENQGEMATKIVQKMNYTPLYFERLALEKQAQQENSFNLIQLSAIVSACEHRRLYTELPDNYCQILYYAELKAEEGERFIADNQEDFPVSKFNEYELLLMGDSCLAAQEGWDNSQEYQSIFDEIMNKIDCQIDYQDSDKNRPDELDLDVWESEKEAMENGEWEEDDEWEEADER